MTRPKAAANRVQNTSAMSSAEPSEVIVAERGLLQPAIARVDAVQDAEDGLDRWSQLTLRDLTFENGERGDLCRHAKAMNAQSRPGSYWQFRPASQEPDACHGSPPRAKRGVRARV